MQLSVIIVTYNSAEIIDRCLAPFSDYIGEDLEVLVWDNASSDDTVDHIRSTYPNVKLFASKTNLGFSRGNDRAFVHCSGEFILLLNPDAFVEGIDQIWSMLRRLEGDDNIGSVGPQLINLDGTHQVGDAGWNHDLFNSVSHFLFLHKIFGLKSLFLSNRRFLSKPEVDVDWVCGACMLVPKRVVKEIGGFDFGIFLYGEDVEWGRRIKDLNKRVVYVPSISVLHLQGASQKGSEGAPYFSTKWLDALIVSVAGTTSRYGMIVFKVAALVGFMGRYLLLKCDPCRSKPAGQSKALNMFKYALYIWRGRI